MNTRFSQIFGISLVTASLLSACTLPPPPPARVSPAAATQKQPPDDKIHNAMSAGPAEIAKDAAVMDYPATPGGKLVELRKGNNGWTCIPDDPSTPTNDPMCLDKQWLIWFEAFIAGTKPNITQPGIAYMLQGGSGASDDDPFATTPPAGKDWQIEPPHVMFIFPDKLNPADYPREQHLVGPWLMYAGTPYEHVMAPIVMTEKPKTQDKIASAMSAGPMAIAKDATIMDYPSAPGGKLVELRKGTNGWTCVPDDPNTSVPDPMCLDKMWVNWLEAFIAGTKPNITQPGIGYMMQGGIDASNDDPFATKPPAGKDWLMDPPHLMLIIPDKFAPDAFPDTQIMIGPWVMFRGTPYEHVMIPGTSDMTMPMTMTMK